MKTKIFSHKQLIGTTELKVGDKSMGEVFGNFIPTQYYFDNFQKYVWEFWKTKKPDLKKWESLKLNAQLENGFFLYPNGGFTFDDIKGLNNKTLRIDIAGVNNEIIKNYIETDTIKPFTEEPWSELEIGQKISFENELRKELGIKDKSLFLNLFKKSSKHDLINFEFSALCHDQRNDNVLFEINSNKSDKQFALVHLTWSGKEESQNYPRTEFYSSFSEFKNLRMIPDKIEWQE